MTDGRGDVVQHAEVPPSPDVANDDTVTLGDYICDGYVDIVVDEAGGGLRGDRFNLSAVEPVIEHAAPAP